MELGISVCVRESNVCTSVNHQLHEGGHVVLSVHCCVPSTQNKAYT